MMHYKHIALCIAMFVFSNQPIKAELIIYCGSMCSGKSEEIIRVVSRQIIANASIIGVFKPLLDNRMLSNHEKDPSKFILSRNGGSIQCIGIHDVEHMEKIVYQNNYSIIAIDEAQFLDKEALIKFVIKMLQLHKKVIIFGLDLDFRGESFGAMGELLAMADKVIKLNAVCAKCGKDTFCITQRIVDGKPARYDDPLIMVGDQQYEPRCRHCHQVRKE